MDAERWQRIEQLCHAVLEREPSEQPAYLDEMCAGDEALRREVESLLAQQKNVEKFLEAPAMEVAAKELAKDQNERERARREHSLIGRRISHYWIVDKLASGGMGEVYRAVRADQAYDKQVAIKLVRAGLDTEFILDRFRTERQVLASLEHSNIARLLDAGTTQEGIPYYVMEFLEGQPIDEYCDSRRLPTTERLRLFRAVCSAVHYAHQRLVVHRDIKPANILVTAEGVPKLLDFGIAKILHPHSSLEQGVPTVTVFRLMTPEYASPEQLRGEAITTATDVYSLGVVLYQVLTGHLPYRLGSRSPHEIVRAVCEMEPERPSSAIRRVEGAPGAGGATTKLTPELVSGARDSQPEKLRRQLSGDLDHILLKAIRKEPQDRYASAEQLSEDIERYLHGRPVIARARTWRYRSAKFVRRNKTGVVAAALVVLALAAGMVTTIQARRRAEKRFNDVRELANSLVFDLHDAIRNLPGATPARKLLVSKALVYLDSLSQEAAGDVSLQRELAAAYVKLGDVQGFLGQSNLGDTAGALQSYQKALAIQGPLCAAHPRDGQAQGELAMIYSRLGLLHVKTGDLAKALEFWRKSLTMREDLAAADPTNAKARRDLALSYDGMGDTFVELNNFDEAGKNYQKEVEVFRALQAADPANATARRDLSIGYKKVGGIFEATGRIPEALEKYREAMELDELLSAADPTSALARRDVSISYTNIGDILSTSGHLPEALERYRQALAIDEALAAADPKDTRARYYVERTDEKIGNLLLKSRNPAGALEYFRRALATARAASDADRLDARAQSDVAALSGRLGDSYAQIAANAPQDQRPGRWQQARSWYQKSLSLWLDLRKRGGLRPREDGETPDKAVQGIARCDAALSKLSAPIP